MSIGAPQQLLAPTRNLIAPKRHQVALCYIRIGHHLFRSGILGHAAFTRRVFMQFTRERETARRVFARAPFSRLRASRKASVAKL